MGHSAIGLQATQAFKNNANLALNKVKSSLGDTLTPRFGAPTFPKVGDANPIPCTNTCTDARVEHWHPHGLAHAPTTHRGPLTCASFAPPLCPQVNAF